ncbi:MAG: hypothetical protein HYW62_02080 [Candidatus Levybacteria bacterium]|nr:hypothetical protein [Candidatus Levybacteria bacterium]
MFKKYLFPLLIVLISVVPLMDLLKPGLPLTHDGQDHVARIANFYQNLLEGNIIPRWAGNLNWGYGHPILEFLYPLPSYFASLFHFVGFTLVDSVKLVFGVSFVLSGLAMYLFVKELLNDKKAALLASLLYIIAPYRFVDLYVRGAIGEHVAFIFPPLVFYFLCKLSKGYSSRYLIGGAISLAGLNLAHNAISLMFLPLMFIFIFYLFFYCSNKKYFILNTLYVMLLGFGLSAFFWIPAFMEGKYTLRDVVTSGGEYLVSFVPWKDFFISEWNYGGTLTLSKQIGLAHWIGVLVSIVGTYYLYINKNKLWIISSFTLLAFWTTLFLMTSSSNFIWQSITTLQKFQFPWRFLSLTVFLSALLASIAFHIGPNKLKKILLLILVVGLLIVNKDYWHVNDFLQKEGNFYTGIYESTTDTGESAPIWSVRFMEKRPKFKMEVISGNAKIKGIERKVTLHSYEVIALEKSRILENTLYFPGWIILVDGKNTNIQFQDPNHRGLMTFYLDKGKHKIEIVYKETRVRQVSNIISLVSLIIMGASFLSLIKKKTV